MNKVIQVTIFLGVFTFLAAITWVVYQPIEKEEVDTTSLALFSNWCKDQGGFFTWFKEPRFVAMSQKIVTTSCLLSNGTTVYK